jgi:hypothetical protein
MTDDIKKAVAEEVARQLAEQKAKDAPKPQPSAAEQERATAEWIDKMHQMREGRMNFATPPSVARYFADGVTPADCADINRAAHAPQGPSSQGAIPSSQQVSNVHTGGSGSGWVDPHLSQIHRERTGLMRNASLTRFVSEQS